MSYSDLKGKTYIVTGAASGMGRTTALLLAKQGANVGLLDLNKPDSVAAEVQASGASAIALACNVQDRNAVDGAVKQVVDKFGPIHGAANMAGLVGVQGPQNSLANLQDSFWDNCLKTNLDGVKNSIRAEIKNMQQEGGSIVNAASIAGQRGSPFNSAYNTSKWGVIGLTKCIAVEVGQQNIRINAVAPGVVNTPLAASLGQDKVDQLLTRVPLKRMAEPEEVSQVILFLLSKQSAYVTGSV